MAYDLPLGHQLGLHLPLRLLRSSMMSESEHHPVKKRKTTSGDSESTTSNANEQVITKSTKIWFEDGNIILQTSTKRYRAHRGILATHSSVFKDMFSLPQPVEQSEVFEGCPVVHLTDSAEDWDELLPLFYNMRDLRENDCQIDLHLMVAMLRLGHKYGCDRFKAQALEQLQRVFPSGLDDCKDMMNGDIVDGASYDEFADGYEFYLLDVAIELGIQTVLPLAFFTCLQNCTIADILDGSYDDGPARSGTLRFQTRKTLLQAKEQIMEDISDKVYNWWKRAKLSSRCTTRDACTDAIRKEAVRMIGVPKIGEVISPSKVPIWKISSLCSFCRAHGKSSIEAGQSRIFDQLPTYFGLPEWDDLKDFEH